MLIRDFNYDSYIIILSLFILNRFRNISLEEIHTMLNFDISKTLAGKQLIEIGEQIGVKQGSKNEKIKTAKKMFQKGFEPQLVKDMTGLPDKEIQKLLH